MSIETEEHRQRHVELHKNLDELVADWIIHNPGKFPSSTTILELIRWSHQQTIVPTDEEIQGHPI